MSDSPNSKPSDQSDGEAGKLKVAYERTEAGVRLVAKTTPDLLKLFVDLTFETPEAAATVSTELLLRLLSDVPPQLVHAAVLDDMVRLAHEGQTITERRVAKGIPSIPGRNGKLLLLVKPYQNTKKDQPVEIVDPKFIRSFDNIENGVPVARIYPPTTGTDGLDCLGKPIPPAPGKPAQWKADATLSVLPKTANNAFETLVAKESGFLTEDRGSLTIKTELVLEEVNYKSGDVDFIGSVKIRGDVQKGFRVSAKKRIEVGGSVLQGSLKCTDGPIVVSGAIVGLERELMVANSTPTAGMLRAMKNAPAIQIQTSSSLTAQLIDSATAQVFGNIEIGKEARASSLHSRAVVSMPEAHLVSGEVFCCCGLDAKRIGSKLGSSLRIVLCSDIESTDEYQKLLARITQHDQVEEMLRLHLGPYADVPIRIQLLNAPLRIRMEEFYEKLQSVLASKQNLLNEKQQMLSAAHQNTTFRVNYREVLHEGVTIEAGDCVFRPQADMTGPGTVEFMPSEKCFVVSELKHIECFLNPDGSRIAATPSTEITPEHKSSTQGDR